MRSERCVSPAFRKFVEAFRSKAGNAVPTPVTARRSSRAECCTESPITSRYWSSFPTDAVVSPDRRALAGLLTWIGSSAESSQAMLVNCNRASLRQVGTWRSHPSCVHLNALT
jgi:hypothetical protein